MSFILTTSSLRKGRLLSGRLLSAKTSERCNCCNECIVKIEALSIFLYNKYISQMRSHRKILRTINVCNSMSVTQSYED